jgi:pyrimidine-nucleoside phosphorylase
MSAMGIKMPMISGRGLGHTGGSLDKIESIPNFNTTLSTNEMLSLLKGQGVFMGGQTDEIAPADKRLYALRHESGTIDSIPLIAASIMSKKLSEGLDGLVLDVKTGSGAFMKSLDDSRELARTMISIGNSMGVKTIAVISDMDQPLGRTVGNALEIKECISAMRGRWADDLRELTLSLGARILQMSDALAEDAELGAMNTFGRKSYFLEQLEFIDKGDVFKKFAEIVDAQGGDPEVVFNPSMLPSASHIHEIKADSNGTIRKMDARAVGIAANLLGAGRMTSKDDIDHAAGIIINQKTGAEVQKGDLIALMHTNDPGQINDAEEAFREGLTIADRAAATRPLIHEVVM